MESFFNFFRDTPYNSETEEEASSRRSLRHIVSPSQSGREWGEEVVFGYNPPNKYDIPSSSRHDTRVASPDHLKIQDGAIQQKINELKGLFSGDRNVKINLIKELETFSFNEIKEAKGWIDIAKKFPDSLSTSRSKAIYDSTKSLLKEMPVNIKDDELEVLFSNNEIKRKDTEKKFIIELTEHFKQELKTTEELFKRVETFIKPFSPAEKWVQDGLKQQLAIAFKKSQITSGESNKPSMANAKLKEAIHESLKDGIPVKEIPKRICGREVTQVSGEGNDCLIRALLKGAHPQYDNYVIESKVQDMRQLLIDKKIAEEGAMLDLGSEQGKELIKYMKQRGCLKHGRDLLVYQYRDGKIQCTPMTDKRSNKPPYAVLLDYENKRFYAVEVPDTSKQPHR